MLSRTLKYTNRNIEYVIVIFILTGIISLNKSFAYIGIHQIYITEFLLCISIASLSSKLLFNMGAADEQITKKSVSIYIRQIWPLLLLFIFAIIRLLMDMDYGLQAVRHSLILLYTVCFTFLFTLAIKNEKHLSFIIIYLLIIFSSVFNGIKILIFKYLHITFNYYEQERVFHVETDTICASVALLGLLVFHKTLWKKSQTGFILLILLNLTLLFLTVKRSAILGLVPSIMIYLYLMKENIQPKKAFQVVIALSILLFISVGMLYYLYPDTLFHYLNYYSEKVSLQEENTNWRLQAWEAALGKLKGNYLWGIGYGPNILDQPINNVDTSDPHNSFLAFFVRHGIIISALYLLFIIRTYIFIFREIKNAVKDSVAYNNAVFICLGLTALIVFAFFNVVMENQYEGIFFNFFLAGIYVINAGKQLKENKPHVFRGFNYIGYCVIIAAFLFISFAFSPFNHVKKITIYNGHTNSGFPSMDESSKGIVIVRSDVNGGIAVSAENGKKITYAELVWFFPQQANKIDFTKYNLAVELQGHIPHMSYFIQYEDVTRTTLEAVNYKGLTQIPLTPLASLKKEVKAKYLIIAFANMDSSNSIVIKNIYLNEK